MSSKPVGRCTLQELSQDELRLRVNRGGELSFRITAERFTMRGEFTAVVLTCVSFVLSLAAHAASVDWDNDAGNGDWNLGTNWSTNAVPADPNDAVFVNSTAAPAEITASIPTLRDIRFGDDNRPGSGTVNHRAGTAQLNGWFRIGIGTGSRGTYNLSGTGNLSVNGRVFIAEQAGTSGTFTQDGGVLNFAAVGGNEGLHVGESGTGVYELKSGSLRQFDVADRENQDSWNRLGQSVGSSGTFNISGGTASFDSRTLVGLNGSGTVNQTGGTFEIRRHELVIGDTTASAVYNISGGIVQTLEAGRPITVGQWDNSNAQLNISGTAQVITAGNLQIGAGRAAAPSRGVVTQSGGTVTVSQNLTLGISSDSLDANLTATGIYNLQGGVLDLTSGSIIRRGTPQSAFNMTGGRLTDAAEIQLSLDQRGGVLAPSSLAMPGTTTISGDYALGLAGTLEISLFSGAPFDYDFLNVNGLVNLAGNLDLIAPAGLPMNTLFLIVTNDGSADPVAGSFAGKPNHSVFAEDGNLFRIDYDSGDGNDVGLTVVVPEPASTALMLVGPSAFWVLFTRRRR